MRTTRSSVVELLRSLGEHDRAMAAACCLSPSVDTDRDALRLHELGLDEQILRSALR